jgi:hypothetical protein
MLSNPRTPAIPARKLGLLGKFREFKVILTTELGITLIHSPCELSKKRLICATVLDLYSVDKSADKHL